MALLSVLLRWPGRAQAAPQLVETDGVAQLLVDGKSFLIRGEELGNSSAGTAAQADSVLRRVAALHVNTVLMPAAWEQIEPVEGSFDFSILNHWIDVAREQHLHLVLLCLEAGRTATPSTCRTG